MTIEAALAELEEMLPGVNYVVSLDLYRVPAIPGGTPKQYVTAALGPSAVIGGTAGVTPTEMIATVERRLRWAGDRGSHPDEAAIRSPRLGELVACVRSHLEHVAASATDVRKFWLLRGHPHYPVQWDFAYVLVGPGGAQVFIGSSSD